MFVLKFDKIIDCGAGMRTLCHVNWSRKNKKQVHEERVLPSLAICGLRISSCFVLVFFAHSAQGGVFIATKNESSAVTEEVTLVFFPPSFRVSISYLRGSARSTVCDDIRKYKHDAGALNVVDSSPAESV